MTNFDRDIQRKLRALRHAEQIGDVSKPGSIGTLKIKASVMPTSSQVPLN